MPDPLADSIRRIAASDPACGFTCGEAALDSFFARHAFTNDENGVGNTFVLPASTPGDPSVLGFYTLSMAGMARGRIAALLSSRARKTLPAYPLPVALIGRLAVHERAQGRNLGSTLLTDALARVVVAARSIACLGVVVDAKNARAEGFYLRYGFKSLDPQAQFPRRMFIPMQTVRDALGS